ncbi:MULTISPECIES: helix-turn-helix transcriptional regulator [Streptomyces]|uniref:HTH luxR-type domain-containing protein n=1 Tax=Streptomyces siderophoricus TaxID=2802281 RepID=A0ABS1N527_9ACTN|nr:LuxR C-terminal-related transcriptional regulator [Streptomyces sp. 9-7]MBL1095005.1 hypothetical protein [Streptomyces sp. 9-7]
MDTRGAKLDECSQKLRDVAEVLASVSRRVGEEAEGLRQASASGDYSPTSLCPTFDAERDSNLAYLYGVPTINEAIQESLHQVRREILTAQPDGPRPAEVLEDALDAVRKQIASGVAMRTLYQHSSRFDEATKAYVRTVAGYGVQVRTLSEFFDRMIIFDRSTAFIPASGDKTSAVKITNPAVVHFMVGLFEREWDRAEQFPFIPTHNAGAASVVMPAMRESILRLLIEGRTDKEIARRLGISQRSLQTHVSQLKKELSAHHRFQLGYFIGRLDERPPI